MTEVAELKRCCTCKQELPLSAFWKKRGTLDGLCHRCKACDKSCRDPEKEKARTEKYKRENRVEILRRKREAWYRNHEKNLARLKARNATGYCNKWYHAHKEKCRASNKRWEAKNPDKVRRKAEKWGGIRRAQKMGVNSSSDAAKAMLIIRGKKVVKCFYCGKKLSGKHCHIDHLIALAKEGSHAASNLVPSCPQCNQRKHTKHPNDFIAIGQLVLI